MQKDNKNINEITENALCTGCGACAGICPVEAISMKENASGFIQAIINNTKCIQCSKCINICPSNGEIRDDDLIGTCIKGYLGYAQNTEMRLQGQSGGVVTAILCYLMKHNIVDAAVITRFNCNIRRAESFLATSIEDIENAKGSHYTQSSVVETILQNQDKRLVAVVLGCQALSLKQIGNKYKNIKLPVLTIGLICGGNLSGYMVDDILRQAQIKENIPIKEFRFRDKLYGGWPGDISIYSDKRIVLPKEKRMELKQYYQNYRCFICANKMNQDCDIVIGDPWGISIQEEKNGYSALISRTEKGDGLLNKIKEQGEIVLFNEDIKKIISGQKIAEELELRHKMSKIVSINNNWRFPYILENDRNGFLKQKISDSFIKKMTYLRKISLSKSKVETIQLIRKEKRKNYHPIREFLYSIKKKLRRN